MRAPRRDDAAEADGHVGGLLSGAERADVSSHGGPGTPSRTRRTGVPPVFYLRPRRSAKIVLAAVKGAWRRPPLQVDSDLDVTSVREVIEDGEAAYRVRAVQAAGGKVVEERLRVARDVENVLEAADEPQRVGVEATARRVDEDHVELPRRRVAKPVGRGAARVRRDPRRRRAQHRRRRGGRRRRLLPRRPALRPPASPAFSTARARGGSRTQRAPRARARITRRVRVAREPPREAAPAPALLPARRLPVG